MKRTGLYITAARQSSLLAIGVGLVLSFMLSSCFKEKPIKQPYINNSGDIHVANMGENYTKQIYFNLQTQVFVDSNSKYNYTIAFDCPAGSYNIWLNGANLMFSCRTGKYNLSDASIADTSLNHWQEELGSGIPSQNAIGTWGSYPSSDRQVYLLNLGEDSSGNSLGYKKMQLGDCTGDNYTVTYCNMDNSNMQTVTVPRKANRNKIYLSMNDNQVHDFEPDYNNWDLIFTQYSIYFASLNLPYKVTGVLTNPYKTQAYFLDSTSNYDKITLDSVQSSRFANYPLDNIGYAWKLYIGFLEYTVDGRHIYIIKSGNHYYKLKFITFSNSSNEKGYPEFQYDELL